MRYDLTMLSTIMLICYFFLTFENCSLFSYVW